MKTNILLTLFLIVCLSIKADDTFYRTLVDGRCWNFMEIYQNDNKTDTVYYSIEIEGEAEIDEKLCYRIKGYETEAFIPYLYEDGGKVFTYKWDKTTESMVWEKAVERSAAFFLAGWLFVFREFLLSLPKETRTLFSCVNY